MSKAFYQVNEYLTLWKKALDEKSLNRELLEKVKNKGPYSRVLDLGTGSGSQIRRLIDESIVMEGVILGVDVNEEGLRESINDFTHWVQESGYEIREMNCKNATLAFAIDDKITVELYAGSVYDLTKFGSDFELVTALSLLEHTNIPKALRSINAVMKPDALLYTPINYNGVTKVRPTSLTEEEDDKLMQLFNETMIDNQHVGGVDVGVSNAGDAIQAAAESSGFTLIGLQDSSWIINSHSGEYEQKAKKFFIDSIHQGLLSLEGEKAERKKKLDVTDEMINEWYAGAQKEDFYCANQDLLLRKNK